MAKKGKGYVWVPGEDPPPIEPHSIAKHEVIYEYVRRYLSILCGGLRQSELKLTLVDGFAGGGTYLDLISKERSDGSPLRLIRGVTDGHADAVQARLDHGIRTPAQVGAEFHFVERDKPTLKFLTALLIEQGYGGRIGETIHLHHANFELICDSIIATILERGRAGRSIFLLDQYGYTQIPFPLVRRIFARLPRAEILFTFATDALTNYLCARNREHYKRNMERIGLELNIDTLLDADQSDANWRFWVESQLSNALRQSSGAKFFTPFFIVSAQSQRAYWLVHLSNHQRARDAMTQVHWEFQNHFAHYGGPGTHMLGYRPGLDDSLRSQTTFTFDDEARRRTDAALLDELPPLIARHSDGIAFRDFAAEIANGTPAHNGILLKVLGQLLDAKMVGVVSAKGVLRRSGGAIKATDRLRVPRQRFFMY